MIHPALHRDPTPLDRQRHRLLRLRRDRTDTAHLAALNSFFVAAAEFGDACREYAVVWIPAGAAADGGKQVAPVAVFGLQQNQNLYLEPDGRWRTPYLPVLLRTYPFAMARTGEDGQTLVLCYDAACGGFSLTDGEPLFDADGGPSEFTREMQRQLEQAEAEVERTRQVGARLLELGLLRDMRFDVTLADERKLAVDGFLTVDDERLAALPDATVGELHRNGLLGLIHAHRLSLGHMRRLVDWHLQREQAASAPRPA